VSEMIGIATVKYVVPDLARAKAWYADAFGVQPYFDEPYYVGFRVGGNELGLDPDLAVQQPGAGGATAYWAVADARATVRRLESLGARICEPLQEVGGGITIGSVLDPFGNIVGIIQNPHYRPGA